MIKRSITRKIQLLATDLLLRLKNLFRLEEVEVDFFEEGDAIQYTYRIIHPRGEYTRP